MGKTGCAREGGYKQRGHPVRALLLLGLQRSQEVNSWPRATMVLDTVRQLDLFMHLLLPCLQDSTY